ncbi:MAG TPA: hypothetical protein VGZ26_06280 [Pirellulales bacterium]|jgi:hypothetical protein|nr:hypothetical protein [Pirellulales bacterium]
MQANRFAVWVLHTIPLAAGLGVLFGVVVLAPNDSWAQPVVPGTGQRVTKVGDDFEDPKWAYVFNLPKSSDENDKQQRLPAGAAKNGRWYEGVMRGQPDVIERVATPEGGIPGSTASLLLRSQQTGVPGTFSGQNQQDDLIVDVNSRLGGPIPVSWSPSAVVRVYLPPWDQWEQRVGTSFGFRAACQAYTTKKGGLFRSSGPKLETYWPGMFIQYNKADARTSPSATLVMRAGPSGHDFAGPRISSPGWWTLGMSFSPDGQVHYYAHPGVEDITAEDHISSQSPYGFRCERLDAVFFNVVNGDNGNWSTSWIIDDPTLYYNRR